MRDAVFYQIFPDRFAQSARVRKPSGLEPWGTPPTPNGYQGGDLLGVAERLDVLAELGVNALIFTPIFQSASNHRYHTHDYERVDPMLGGDDALRRLIEQAHRRGMRVILDGVFNHASRGFFPFHDILENGPQSAYLDWFEIHDFPLNAYIPGERPNYGAWWNLPALPKFKIQTPAVKEYLLGIARKWIDFGIDGWRLDVPNEIDDDDFWRAFRQTVKRRNREAYIVGEVWGDAQRWLKGDMWDAVMNYQFAKACIAYFIADRLDTSLLRRTSLYPPGAYGAPAFRDAVLKLLHRYPAPIAASQLNLLGSHDMARFATLARGDQSALKLAMIFQMTYPGAPSIYYGDEIGMVGGHDPENRGAFPWDRQAWDQSLRSDYKRWIALRHTHAALRRGSYLALSAGENIHSHLRQYRDEAVVVVINAGWTEKRLTLPTHRALVEGTILRDPWTGDEIKVSNGILVGARIAGRSGRVYATPLVEQGGGSPASRKRSS